jgi:hypothetical protein
MTAFYRLVMVNEKEELRAVRHRPAAVRLLKRNA